MENQHLVRGLTVSFWAEPASGRFGFVRGGPGGPAEPQIRWGFAGSCLLASIFTGSKRFFWFLLRGPLFMVPDTGDLRVYSCVRRLDIVIGLFVYSVYERCTCGWWCVFVSEQIL